MPRRRNSLMGLFASLLQRSTKRRLQGVTLLLKPLSPRTGGLSKNWKASSMISSHTTRKERVNFRTANTSLKMLRAKMSWKSKSLIAKKQKNSRCSKWLESTYYTIGATRYSLEIASRTFLHQLAKDKRLKISSASMKTKTTKRSLSEKTKSATKSKSKARAIRNQSRTQRKREKRRWNRVQRSLRLILMKSIE